MTSLLPSCICLCLLALLDNEQVECQRVQLNMYENSLDDQYIGCISEMEAALPELLKKERKEDPELNITWESASKAWAVKKSSFRSLPKGFQDEHGIAIVTYSNMTSIVYKRLNRGIREYGLPPDNFKYHSLHFYLTRALTLLRRGCDGNPIFTYRGASKIGFEPPSGSEQNIRFSQFASSSTDIKEAEQFGNATFFRIVTCFGVDIQKFSYFPSQKEVLIPVDEVFRVSSYVEEGNTFILESTSQRCSFYNCAFLGDLILRVTIRRGELHTALLESEWDWATNLQKAELQVAEFQARSGGSTSPKVQQNELVQRDHALWQLWRDVIKVQQEYLRKVLPTSEERYWLLLDLRMPFLGEQPREEWVSELEGLVQTEMVVDDGYRALRWYVTQLCSGLEEDEPTEGYDFGDPGLVLENLQEDPDFGNVAEWWRWDLQDFRELDIPDALGLRTDLDFTILQEWELEKSYKKLFDLIQQHAPDIADCPDFTSDYVDPGGVDWTVVSTPGTQGCWQLEMPW
ncbi:uncharacterized protein WCC33_001383 [Rhinophrynus dorsalis]